MIHLNWLHLSVDSCMKAKKLFAETWESKKSAVPPSFLWDSVGTHTHTHTHTHTLSNIHPLHNYLSPKESVKMLQ